MAHFAQLVAVYLSGEMQGLLNALGARGTLQLGAWRVADFSGQRLQATFTATQIPTAPQATLRAQLVKIQGPTLAPSSVSVEGTYATQQGTFTVAVTEGPYQRSRPAPDLEDAAPATSGPGVGERRTRRDRVQP